MLALVLQGPPVSESLQREVTRGDERRRLTVALTGSNYLPRGARTAQEREQGAAPAPKVIPIRLPAELHEQLSAWCTEHNFAMAAVVRGLVKRFLESEQLR